MGPPGAVIALAGIAALAALIRRHTGMEIGMALCLIAVVGLVGLAWVVFALLAVALVGVGGILGRAFSQGHRPLISWGPIFVSGDRPTIAPWHQATGRRPLHLPPEACALASQRFPR